MKDAGTIQVVHKTFVEYISQYLGEQKMVKPSNYKNRNWPMIKATFIPNNGGWGKNEGCDLCLVNGYHAFHS